MSIEAFHLLYALHDLATLTYIEVEHAQSSHITHGVGAVGKPQACWTENAWFVAPVSHVQPFETHGNQFFTDIYRLVVVQHPRMPRTRDMAIFVVTTDRQTSRQTNRLLYPCACARGNYMEIGKLILVLLSFNSYKGAEFYCIFLDLLAGNDDGFVSCWHLCPDDISVELEYGLAWRLVPVLIPFHVME